MAQVTITDVVKTYPGNVTAVKGINLDIQDGEFMVLVGPSGCGKSTTLRMTAGLEEITGGTIAIGDRVVNDVAPKDRDIAMVFQNYALYPHMTVYKNMAFGLKLRKFPKAEIDSRVRNAADILGINSLLDRKPKALSGGQRQRVALGRAIVRDPAVFLFDEPLSNLDAKLRVDMRTEIKKLHQKLGTTIVYVTHDQIEAMTLSTRIAVMYNGYVQQLGTPKEIYDTPSNIFVATFMGSPAMNVLPAKLVELNGAMHVELAAEDGAKHLRIENAPAMYKSYIGKEIRFGIRPEAITDPEGADRNATNIQMLSNTVGVTEPAGADTFVTMSLAGQDCVARMRADADVHAGAAFEFAVNMDKAVLFDPESEARIA